MKATHVLKAPRLATALAALALAGCGTDGAALARADGAPSCMRPAQITSWTLMNDDTVLIRVGSNDVYQLDLMGPCPQFDWTRSLGFETRNGVSGASLVCANQPENLTVLMPVGNNVLRCPVKTIRPLSAVEVAALPSALRP